MATRTRSMIIDNTVQKVFTNLVNPAQANPANVCAGTELKRLVLCAFGTAVSAKISPNITGRTNGVAVVTSTLLTKLYLDLASTAVGGTTGVAIALKVGTTYETASTVATHSSFIKASSKVISVLIEPGQNIYLDITGTGTTRPGSGVRVSADYFSG